MLVLALELVVIELAMRGSVIVELLACVGNCY
jgi:hypothetical protein